ncbi:MAG: hypothetical protein COV70_04250 [Parcubacteria group bacterium CG11_big_fil_rev_8_21_14_0_20_39_22]|nr:MAG: hypothetical protein COV70_04250 [Parcubacteria group bacterium CG11_big_fil_rev_8_21_14_0_20_39_22]
MIKETENASTAKQKLSSERGGSSLGTDRTDTSSPNRSGSKYELPRSLNDRRRMMDAVNRVFTDAGEDSLSKEEVTEMRGQKPKIPSFPIYIFLMAVFKDIIDTPSVITDSVGVTGVGLVFTGFYRFLSLSFSVLASVIIFLWILGKTSLVRKMLWKKLVWRYAVAFLAENLVPIIPTVTIAVLLAHFRETKIVRLTWSSLEALDKFEKQRIKNGK